MCGEIFTIAVSGQEEVAKLYRVKVADSALVRF